jgi:hypothetical protein
MDLDIKNIDIRVLLLAIYKKANDETVLDIVKKMENSKVFTLKQGKKYLKFLKLSKYILNNKLTVIGIEKSKEIEQEFKI